MVFITEAIAGRSLKRPVLKQRKLTGSITSKHRINNVRSTDMPRIDILVPHALDEQIAEFMTHWGFQSKAEFFRHAAQTYLSQNERMNAARKIGIRLPLHVF